MNMKLEKITNEELENVAGGFTAIFSATNRLTVSQKEYDKLKVEGYITDDGKLCHAKVGEVVTYLENNGFDGGSAYLAFMWRGYKAPIYANLIIGTPSKYDLLLVNFEKRIRSLVA